MAASSNGGGGDDLKASFVFVPHGDPLPLEWMARHPGWVKFPATFVPRPVPRRVVPSRMWDEAGMDEAPGYGPMSRPVSVGAPVVQRRRVPVHRLPTGGPRDAEDPIAAYLRISKAADEAASTWLASAPGSSVAGPKLDGHAVAVPGGHKGAVGGEHHSQARHGEATRARAHQSPITPKVAAEIEAALLNPMVQAFLRLLSFEEIGQEREKNYRIRFGDLVGRDPITDEDMRHYKPKNMRSKGKPATAGGAYQILEGLYYEALDRGVVADFFPASQDKIAVYKILEKGALEAILNHDLDRAFTLLRGTWSSLPGGTQTKENLENAKRRYDEYLGE